MYEKNLNADHLFWANIAKENEDFNIQEFLNLLHSITLKKESLKQTVDIGEIEIDQIEKFPIVSVKSYLEEKTENISKINPHWQSIQIFHTALADLVDKDSEYGSIGDVLIESENDCYSDFPPFNIMVVRKIGSNVSFSVTDLFEDIDSPEYKQAEDYLNQIFVYAEIVELSKQISLKEEVRYRFFMNSVFECFKIDRHINIDTEDFVEVNCLEFYTKQDMFNHVQNHNPEQDAAVGSVINITTIEKKGDAIFWYDSNVDTDMIKLEQELDPKVLNGFICFGLGYLEVC
jgi:hypothetical protein